MPPPCRIAERSFREGDFRRGPLTEDDGNGIEPIGDRFPSQHSAIGASGSRQIPLLSPINGCFRSCDVGRRSRFDFDEREHISVIADDVNLADNRRPPARPSEGNPDIGGHDAVSGAMLQVFESKLFPSSPQLRRCPLVLLLVVHPVVMIHTSALGASSGAPSGT